MTGGATDGSGQRPTLLAPVRTRPPAVRTAAEPGLPLLPPVLSGLFAQSTPQTKPRPAAPISTGPVKTAPIESAFFDLVEPAADDTTAGLPLISDDQSDRPEDMLESAVDWFADDDAAPWEQADESESTELVLEIDEEEGDFVLHGTEAAVGADDRVLTEDTADADEPAIRPAPAPLSPWDLGAANAGAEAAEHAARAKAEWESLGRALTGSLSVDSPATQPRGAHEIELTDEIVASLEAQVGDSYSPFADLIPPSAIPGLPPGHAPGERGKRAALSDLARRLEAFAARIRAEGPEALARAQKEGDRVDALLAGIAAGFIAGRGE